MGATTLAQSLWMVASGDALVARVSLLPPRAAAQADRRALAEQLRDDIAAALAA